MSRFYSF